jgi:hypothetical protein
MRNLIFFPLFCLLIIGMLFDSCSKDKSETGGSPPSVGTTHALISATTAEITGKVTDSGSASVKSVGVCLSTSTGPSIGNSLNRPGSGYPQFYSFFSNLTPNTVYYVRAYATNTYGTSYGNEIMFMTLDNRKTLCIERTVRRRFVGAQN